MANWVAPPKGGYQGKAPEFKVGADVEVKLDIPRHGGLKGTIEAPLTDGPYDWWVSLPGRLVPMSIKFKESELNLLEPKRVPPKNPASSSRIVHPAGTEPEPPKSYRSTESLLGEILEVLKEIRESLKPKEPTPFGNRAMGAVAEMLPGNLKKGSKYILDDGRLVEVSGEITNNTEEYNVPVLEIPYYADGAYGCDVLPHLKIVKVVKL